VSPAPAAPAPAARAPRVRPRFLRAALFFLAAFLVYSANCRRIATHDSLGTALLPFAFLSGEGARLDRFVGDGKPFPDSYCFHRDRDGHVRNTFGVGAAVVATPFYLPALFLPGLDPADPVAGPRLHAAFEKTAAAGIAALAGMLLLLRLEHDLAPRAALVLAAAFAFATPVWSVASQALFQHGPVAALLAGGLLALAPRRVGPWRAALAGLLAGGLCAVRPTAGLLAAALAWLAWRRGGRTLLAFALPAAVVGVVLLVQAYGFFDSPLAGYAAMGAPRFGWEQVPATFAALVASNRGLLFGAPVLLALLLPWRRPRSLDGSEAGALFAAVGATLLGYSGIRIWSGGSSYLGRYPIDLLPLLFVLGAGALAGPLPRWRRMALAGLGAVAVPVQLLGVFAYPWGESGRATEPATAWSLRRSAPYLALQAGLAPPELFPLARRGAQRAQPMDGILAEVRIARPLPATWRRFTTFPAVVEVANRGARAWPDWGSYAGEFSTRLLVVWSRADGQRLEVSEFSLGGTLAAGARRRIEIDLLAPHRQGRWQVDLAIVERRSPGQGHRFFDETDPQASKATVWVAGPKVPAARVDWPPPRNAR
jgi:hypothetical protein